jgi:hypothetical protein
MNRNSYRKPRGLRFEPLEQRQQFAGDVEVAVVGGNLSILGDNEANHLVITATDNPGEFVIAGNGTTVNSSPAPLTVTGVVGDVTILMQDGDDILEFDTDPAAFQFDGDVVIDMGSTVEPVFSFNELRATGANDFSVDGSLTVLAGYQGFARFDNAHIVDDVTVVLEGDMGAAELIGGSVGGNFTALSTGENKDVRVSASIAGDVNIELVGLGDRISFEGESGSPLQIGGQFTVTLDTDMVSLGYVAINGDLVLNGSGSAHLVSLVHSSVAGDFLVDGSGGITFFASTVAGDALFTLTGESSVNGGLLTDGNGMPLPTPFSHIGGNLDITFGLGNGSTRLAFLNVNNDLTIRGSDSAEDIRLNNVRAGNDLTIDTGAGNDIVWVHNSSCDGEASVLAGAGNDYLWTHNVLLANSLNVDAAAGFDLVSLWYTSAKQNLTVSAGVDSDQVGVFTTAAKNLTVDAGNGYDIVRIESSAADTLYANLGDGGDSMAVLTSLVRLWALLDGGPGFDSFYQSGSLVSGALRRNFEFMSG